MTYAKIKEASTTSGKPELILFYSLACAPCALLKPRLIRIYETLGLTLHMINVASEMDAVRKLDIRNAPTVVMLNYGETELLFSGNTLSDQHISLMLQARMGV